MNIDLIAGHHAHHLILLEVYNFIALIFARVGLDQVWTNLPAFHQSNFNCETATYPNAQHGQIGSYFI